MKKLKWLIICFSFFCFINVYAVNFKEKERIGILYKKPFPQLNSPLFSRLKLHGFKVNNDQLIISHFYQHVNDDIREGAAWNVTTASAYLCSDYYRLGLSIDQGDYTATGDRFGATNVSYRVGLQLEQVYEGNDSLTFGVWMATEEYFPGITVKANYQKSFGKAVRAGININYLAFESHQYYIAIAPVLIKTFSHNELILQPYYSVSGKNSFNLLISDKIFIKQKINHLEFVFISGYYPKWNTIIDYYRINDNRYTIACEGTFYLCNDKFVILPAIGSEYTKGKSRSFYANWYMQLGIRINL